MFYWNPLGAALTMAEVYTLSEITDNIESDHVTMVTPNCYIIQWNIQTRDSLGLIVLSLVERLSLSLK